MAVEPESGKLKGLYVTSSGLKSSTGASDEPHEQRLHVHFLANRDLMN
jgi:hypothetical protein